jgi:hypothetical protein
MSGGKGAQNERVKAVEGIEMVLDEPRVRHLKIGKWYNNCGRTL